MRLDSSELGSHITHPIEARAYYLLHITRFGQAFNIEDYLASLSPDNALNRNGDASLHDTVYYRPITNRSLYL